MFNNYMKYALDEALSVFETEVPVGAVIVDNFGNIIGKGSNKMIQINDPTAHAEIIAIRDACKNLNTSRLTDYSIFITLEPCEMCYNAIKLAKIKNIYFGSFSKNKNIDNHMCNIYDCIMEKECNQILSDFFSKKR